MLHSAEIRWFFPEPEMGAFQDLFPKAPPGDRLNWQQTRTDIYRVIPGADILGLKVRGDGGLQLKSLRSAPAEFLWKPEGEFALPVMLGRTDAWVKWDLPENRDEKLLPDAREVHVRKVRWVRKYSADRGALRQVYAHGPGSRPASGCTVERTELTAGQERWLSLGLEAFGEPDRVRATLDEAVALVMQGASESDILGLSGACSQSYPAWLDAYVRRVTA